MSVVPPSFITYGVLHHLLCSQAPVTKEYVDSYHNAGQLLFSSFAHFGSKLQGAFPPHFRKIFTRHLLSVLSCVCTVPYHSRSIPRIIADNKEKVNRKIRLPPTPHTSVKTPPRYPSRASGQSLPLLRGLHPALSVFPSLCLRRHRKRDLTWSTEQRYPFLRG